MNVETVSRLRGDRLNKWKSLLCETDLHADTPAERTVLVWEEGELIATGGRDGNVLKMLAVSPFHQGEDLLSTVITELRRDAFEDGYTHLFLYTKPKNKYIFTSLFFYPVAETADVLVMENKRGGIEGFLNSLPEENGENDVGALVMNCNPFTKGHQYLIEKASAECGKVYVFVLSEKGEGFSPEDRLAMVKAGTAHLPNVTVLETGPYLISSATFPTYFLKDRDRAENVLCDVDVEIFSKLIAPRLKIKKRYVGTEPLSPMTDTYNAALAKGLPGAGIELRVVERKTQDDVPISASAVRRHIAEGNLTALKTIVPTTTYDYLCNHGLI